MKNTKFYHVWNVLYPVLVYVILSDCVYTILTMAGVEEFLSKMALQILTALISSPVIFFLYHSDRKMEKAQTNAFEEEMGTRQRKIVQKLTRLLLICFASALLAIGLNNLIALTPMQEQSAGYQKVTKTFFSSTLWIELLGTSVITPIIEETLYRGIVFKRLRAWNPFLPSMILSAVIFGAMHFNLVQFLYAGFIGAFLAFVLETENKLYVPVLAHATANAVSVFRVETGFLGWLTKENPFLLPISIIMLLVAGIVIWYIGRNKTSVN
ncbi:MAG: lysostaphin resistance A-like protein [Roseburia sp.]|uniref:CPBP family intramembrane glutamic endopeptidase n=1 Tax=Roseburia hominis TaxID=301301 RepID=UPI001F29C3AB|nr:CPBP family intramembrane metalloprotease [Roseburia hominis]MDY4838051.1 CPBP family intramembrane glutamic endopeptidase [Lachnospiraceae bacterium]